MKIPCSLLLQFFFAEDTLNSGKLYLCERIMKFFYKGIRIFYIFKMYFFETLQTTREHRVSRGQAWLEFYFFAVVFLQLLGNNSTERLVFVSRLGYRILDW
jgi:hypothetical protein